MSFCQMIKNALKTTNHCRLLVSLNYQELFRWETDSSSTSLVATKDRFSAMAFALNEEISSAAKSLIFRMNHIPMLNIATNCIWLMVLSWTPGVKQLSSIKQQSQSERQLMFEPPGTFKNRLQLLVCLRWLVNTSTELVTSYSIPIIRMAGHFHGLTLANYDKAFRRDAASRNITDYSLKWTLSCSSTTHQRFYSLRFGRLS